MKRLSAFLLVFAFFLFPATAKSQDKKIKVIADQDSGGPQGSNILSLLMLLRAKQIELLGITTVSGDQWVEPATVFALWATEVAGRTDVPVIKGAEYPLLHTRRAQELQEQLYGSYVGWHGSLNPDAPKPEETWAPPGGFPKTKPRPGRAADFIFDSVRANPGEVLLYCAGPLTNIALAVRLDPGIVPLVKAIYIMGGSSEGGPELNWWWDAEAAAIVLREPWKQIVVSPFEAGAQLWCSERLMKEVAASGGKFSDHVKQLYLHAAPPPGMSLWSMMWDELLVASIIDPSVIKRSEIMYLDVDVQPGPKYGYTVVWEQPADIPEFFLPYSGPRPPDRTKWQGHLTPPEELHPASVQMEVDVPKFEKVFVNALSN